MHGVVSCGSPHTAKAAVEVLKAGGNAVDAAIAATFATSVGEAALTSLGGGGVALVREPNGKRTACNFFSVAPGLGGTPENLDFDPVEVDFKEGGVTQIFHVGRGSAAVPGTLPGLKKMHEKWGSLAFNRVVAPAVTMLREGVPLSAYEASTNHVLLPILTLSELGRQYFFRPDGTLKLVGDTFVCPELADTYESFGEDPQGTLDQFREECLGAFGLDKGGYLSGEDFDAFHVSFDEPLSLGLPQGKLYACPLPTQGGSFILETLKLCLEHEVDPVGETKPYTGRLTAILRAISECRVHVPNLLEQTNLEDLLREQTQKVFHELPENFHEPRTPGNTTHISVIDQEGMAVGITLSYGEGNGHVVPNTGVFMNNFLGEADLFPEGFHQFTPGTRLPTMMAPCLLERTDGSVTVLGAGGSNRIRTAIPQVVLRLLGDVSLQDAVSLERLHVEGGKLSVEIFDDAFRDEDLKTAKALVTQFQPMRKRSLFFGGVHVARRGASGELEGGGDPRRSGTVKKS